MVEIALPLAYPRMPPQCRMLTPIFHPNIAPHAICIGDHWSPGEPLWSIMARIGEMIAYQSYNTKSPLNGEAARWVDEHLDELPLDPVSMMPDDAGPSPSAATRPAAAASPSPARSRSVSAATGRVRSAAARSQLRRRPTPSPPSPVAAGDAGIACPQCGVDLAAPARAGRKTGALPTLPHCVPDPVAITQVGAPMSEVGVRTSDCPATGDGSAQRHRQVLAIACAVGVLAFALQELPDGRVAVRGFPQVPLPQTCASRAVWGSGAPAAA